VVCFPEGTAPTSEKIKKTQEAVAAGAKEIDMVLNRDLLKAKKYSEVLQDIKGVVEASGGAPVKVILETSELNREEKAIACALSKIAGAAFVKTSTGFSKSGATEEDVRLMRQIVGPEMGVKASGGVRSHEDAVKMVSAGASRLGTSASVAIVSGAQSQSSY
ncbi:deoxyribose-phosphate aldolase, partial [bacterium]|nr:deoxyribose-phosphate aldolase [bacterium]